MLHCHHIFLYYIGLAIIARNRGHWNRHAYYVRLAEPYSHA